MQLEEPLPELPPLELPPLEPVQTPVALSHLVQVFEPAEEYVEQAEQLVAAPPRE